MNLLNTIPRDSNSLCCATHCAAQRNFLFKSQAAIKGALDGEKTVYCMKQNTCGVITANSSTGQNQKEEVSSCSNEDAVQKHGTCSIRIWARHHRRSMKFHVMTTATAGIPCASMRSASQISHIVGTGRKGLSSQAQSGGVQQQGDSKSF